MTETQGIIHLVSNNIAKHIDKTICNTVTTYFNSNKNIYKTKKITDTIYNKFEKDLVEKSLKKFIQKLDPQLDSKIVPKKQTGGNYTKRRRQRSRSIRKDVSRSQTIHGLMK
jgi:hypothetical protein